MELAELKLVLDKYGIYYKEGKIYSDDQRAIGDWLKIEQTNFYEVYDDNKIS